MSVIIFANPPFTFRGNTTSEQKLQMKKYGVRLHYDATFVKKAASEGMYDGCWIMCSTTFQNNFSIFDNIKVVPGDYRYDIISNGTQPEMWWFTSNGTTEVDIAVIQRSKSLTDAFSSIRTSAGTGSSGIGWNYSGYSMCKNISILETGTNFIIPTILGLPARVLPNSANGNGNVYYFNNPTEWTLRAQTSKAFRVWGERTNNTKRANGTTQISISRQYNTFPLFQGDDLSHYESLSDEEIFQELYQKYLKLINK